MSSSPQRILLTGANGTIGRSWLEAIGRHAPGISTRAVVRSSRAAAQIEALGKAAAPEETRIVDYTDPKAIAAAAKGCDAAIHLVGILRETPPSTYADAHEATCQALAEGAAKAGLRQIVYPSIFGASPQSSNACLGSKGRAERILLEGPVAATILRLPMVMERADAATRALRNQAQSPVLWLPGGGSTLQQPIDVRDVISALLASVQTSSPQNTVLELGGPEVLSHRELVGRAAKILGGRPRIVGIPLPLVRAASLVLETLLGNPPITRTVLEVLQHDDCVDNSAAFAALGIALRDLDTTLRYCLQEDEDAR